MKFRPLWDLWVSAAPMTCYSGLRHFERAQKPHAGMGRNSAFVKTEPAVPDKYRKLTH